MSKKNLKTLLIATLAVFALASCRKTPSPQETAQGIENLNIPASFDWETSQYTTFQIFSEKAAFIKIQSADNPTVYHNGFYNHLEDFYTIALRIPSFEKQLLVNGQLVVVQSNTMQVNLDTQQKNSSFIKKEIPGDLLAWWRFDEGSGAIAADETGNFNGTILGATHSTGINGGALHFSGNNDNVRIQSHPGLNTIGDQMSLSVWFSRDNLEQGGAFFFYNTKYIMRLDKNGKLSFSVYVPTFVDAASSWRDRITDLDWHHVVGVYNGIALQLYLDGVLINSVSASGNLQSSAADLLVGSQSSQNFFIGQLDEAMIFNKALSPEEVAYLFTNNYNPSNGNASLMAHWPLDAISSGKVVDIVGGFDATAKDLTVVTGMVDGSMNFNGSSSSAIAAHHPNINPGAAFTMMAWVNARENKTSKIVQKGDWDGHGIGQGKWDGWNVHIRGTDQITHDVHWGEGLPILGNWYHLAVTYDGSILKMFVNGQFKNAKKIDIPLNSNSRPFSIGSDNGSQKFFNGLIDDVKYYSTALSAIEIQTAMAEAPEVADADGDGIPDEEDDFPNDPARAFTNYFPASGYGSLAFEDLWPGKGDYDFNDLVVDYRFNMITNQANKITEIEAVFAVRANGAGLQNGFGFQLPGNIPASDFEVSGYRIDENYISLNENGTEAGQQIPTIIVFDNIKNILQSDAGFGANVLPELPYLEPDTLRIVLLLTPNTYLLSHFQPENFNPFLIVDMERGKEIHLPDYAPTDLANASYFGQMDDDSDPASGRFYKTQTQLPWAINIIESFDYTIESNQITQGHLHFSEWAESGGTVYPDWFQNKSGYRSASHIYAVPQ